MVDKSILFLDLNFVSETRLSYPQANETEVSEFDYKWEVPVTYITSGNQERSLKWLSRDEASIEM